MKLRSASASKRASADIGGQTMQTRTPPIELRSPVIIDVFEPDCYWNASMGVCPLTMVEGDSDRCALCGQAISWRVVVISEGKCYSIGRDCAKSIAKINSVAISYRSKRAEARSAAARAVDAAREALQVVAANPELATRPHPMRASKRWAAKLTMKDYCQYWLDAKSATKADIERACKIATLGDPR